MSPELYRVPLRNQVARIILRPAFRGLFHILARVRISGKENVPARGPYLIAMNHVSIFDPPFLVAFWPVCPEAAGAAEIWSKPGQATLVRLFGGIPVHRSEYDRQLIDKMLAVLASGKPLLIAPEGGRSHNPGMLRGQPGIAYLVDRAGSQVVPVGIIGTTDDFFTRATHGARPLLEMNIGQPFNLPPVGGKGDERRKARQQNVDLVMLHIAALLPVEYRGIYQTTQEVSLPATNPEKIHTG